MKFCVLKIVGGDYEDELKCDNYTLEWRFERLNGWPIVGLFYIVNHALKSRLMIIKLVV